MPFLCAQFPRPSQRGREHASPGRPVVSGAGDADHVRDSVMTDRVRGRSGHGEITLHRAAARDTRRNQPEQTIGPRQGALENRGIRVRALDDFHLAAHSGVQRFGSRTITRIGSWRSSRPARTCLPIWPVGVVITSMAGCLCSWEALPTADVSFATEANCRCAVADSWLPRYAGFRAII